VSSHLGYFMRELVTHPPLNILWLDPPPHESC
jgi:hypothetical protein